METILMPKTVTLTDYVTFKIGGPCDNFFEANSVEELKYAVFYSKQKNLPCLILGGGSNILFDDKGYKGVVIKLNMKEFFVGAGSPCPCILKTQAGASMAQIVGFTIENGYSGMEWASGLPGSVGGAIRGNAGAFGGCISDNIISVTYMDEKDVIRSIGKDKCRFGYRDSVFKHNRKYVILEAEFSLGKGKTAQQLKTKYEDYTGYRAKNHPLDYPSAGSVFKNVEERKEINQCLKMNPRLQESMKHWRGKISAAYLIEDCGLKCVRIGGARISEKHANFIVNENNASSDDVKKLIRAVIEKVRDKYGVTLQLEIYIA